MKVETRSQKPGVQKSGDSRPKSQKQSGRGKSGKNCHPEPCVFRSAARDLAFGGCVTTTHQGCQDWPPAFAGVTPVDLTASTPAFAGVTLVDLTASTRGGHSRVGGNPLFSDRLLWRPPKRDSSRGRPAAPALARRDSTAALGLTHICGFLLLASDYCLLSPDFWLLASYLRL